MKEVSGRQKAIVVQRYLLGYGGAGREAGAVIEVPSSQWTHEQARHTGDPHPLCSCCSGGGKGHRSTPSWAFPYITTCHLPMMLRPLIRSRKQAPGD